MLDINLIRKNPRAVEEALRKRVADIDVSIIVDLDKKHREALTQLEQMRARRNKVSAEIPLLKKNGQDVSALLDEMKKLGREIKETESNNEELQKKLTDLLEALPNMPAPDVAAGGKENNQILRTGNSKPSFSFTPKDHLTLCAALGLVDYERGVKLGGSGFWVYRGKGALLEWALINYFIQEHTKDGYEFLLVPHLLNWQSGFTAGQFPKFADDVFQIKSPEGETRQLFLLPTAETALVNLHQEEILSEQELPKRYCAFTPCYRKEAGGYRSTEKGMIRGHQFNKVELVAYTTPESSDKMHEELVKKAEKLVADLGLHYQLSKLAAQDASASMAKTYDIEIWIPSMNEHKEVSSASNGHDYQARRGMMRYRTADGDIRYLHTLNASGLATSRLFPAIIEHYQQADGSIIVPEVLRKLVPFDRITAS